MSRVSYLPFQSKTKAILLFAPAEVNDQQSSASALKLFLSSKQQPVRSPQSWALDGGLANYRHADHRHKDHARVGTKALSK